MTREAILCKALDMASHNLLCCSANLAMTKPKEGCEEQYEGYKKEIELLEAWIEELASAPSHFNTERSEMEQPFIRTLGEPICGVILTHDESAYHAYAMNEHLTDVISPLIREVSMKRCTSANPVFVLGIRQAGWDFDPCSIEGNTSFLRALENILHSQHNSSQGL